MNSEIRRRKLKEQNGRPVAKRKRKEAKQFSVHQSILCLIACGAILTTFLLLYVDNIPWHLGHKVVDSVAKTLGHSKLVHAIIIDGGSTGSRVLAFTFHKAYIDDHLVLDKELFVHTTPGLSSFAENPEKAVESINYLIEKAKNEIPQEYWKNTPLVLRATAGLRMLSQEKAENLLNSIRKYFNTQPFLTDDESVAIMDGTDEGIFSWFTVNFLLERMHGANDHTVAALDLGGVSTQVTFAPSTPETLSQKDYIHLAISPSGSIPVYTHSYMGLGLMAARQAVITKDQLNKVEVTSKCVSSSVRNKKFRFGDIEYSVSGDAPDSGIPSVDFIRCSQIVKEYVTLIAKPISELPQKQINAFSYYVDRASDIGLIDTAKGGHVYLSQFKDAAAEACRAGNASEAFLCLDLTFIWSLLETGFGLKPGTKISLFKKVNGHEISWALGAAFNVLKRT